MSTHKLNSVLLNNQRVIEKIKKEIKNCDTAEAALTVRFIALIAYVKKEMSQSESLTLYLRPPSLFPSLYEREFSKHENKF